MLEIHSPSDFDSRERYTTSIDPKSSQLVAVLSPYRFKDKIHCGLTSCRTPHNFGYLILTADGRETNIGNDCGRKHFGKEFTTQRNIEEKKRKRLQQIQTLKNIHCNKEELLRRIADLGNRPYGVAWLLRSRISLPQAITPQLYHQLNARARRGDTEVSEIRERSDKEIKRLQELNPGSKRDKWRYEATHVGTFTGLEGLAFEASSVFVIGLEQKLRILLASDIDRLSGKELSVWVNWSNGIEHAFQQTEAALLSFGQFFQSANFKLLPHLTTDENLKRKLAALIWDEKKGEFAKQRK